MNKAVISNRIYLSKTPELLEVLEQKLHYMFAQGRPQAPPIEYFDVTSISPTVLSIPVARLDLIPEDYEIIDKRSMPEYVFPDTKVSLREDQQVIYDQVAGSCIINAMPGWGKTFMGLYIARKLGLKTLVIVHTVALRDQWAKEVKKMFGITPGIIGSGLYQSDRPIVVSNVQTLSKHIDKLSSTFGTVILDECHHTPSTTFRNLVDKLRCKNKIGLSATLRRKDGRHVLITDYIATKVLVPEDANRLTPRIEIINTQIPLKAGMNVPWANSINELTAREDYLILITDVARAASVAGHTVLVVTDRVDFATRCSELVDNSVCITGTTEDREEMLELLDSGDIAVVFASMAIFKEGINAPILSAMVLAAPIGNNEPMLIQLIGRITRPCEGKQQPVVFDIGLKGNTAHRQLQARIGTYINSNYKIKYSEI